MTSGQTTSKRNRRNKLKKRYAKAREDAQLAGLIPTTPGGAVRDERVDPRSQGCQQLPQLVRQALKNDWNTPDEAKPAVHRGVWNEAADASQVLPDYAEVISFQPSVFSFPGQRIC